ncbi:MAG: hypothetical protein K8T91_03380 [Planctomycetes bacterium]|nr:hypothetical protein [Planctomycetota bacterium]
MIEPVYTAEIVCPGCAASVPAGAGRCAKCGVMMGQVKTVPVAASTTASLDTKPMNAIPLQERRWLVICTMVFAALFLGFPFLWKSRAFSLAEKIFWTIAVLVETVLVFWVFYVAMAWTIGNIRDALQ